MKEIPLDLCLPPHLLVGSEDLWQDLLRQPSALRTYAEQMRRIEEEACPTSASPDHNGVPQQQLRQNEKKARQTPACFAILPSRPGNRYEIGADGALQGVLIVRPGESWSRLFGAAWQYVRELPVNEPLRRRFPNPDLLHPGAEIRYPYHLRRLNRALDEFRAASTSRIPLVRSFDPTSQELRCPPLVGNGPALTTTLVACPVQWKYEPQEFTAIQHSCAAIHILRSKVKLTLTLDPRTISAAQPRPKAVLTASHRSGAEPTQAIQLKTGDAEIEVDALGAVSVKTEGDWKTEFEPPESGRLPKVSPPPFKIVPLETRGTPPYGTKDEIELGPSVRPNAFGRIEIGLSFSRVVSLQHHGRTAFSLGIEVEASIEFDPRQSLEGHACRPYARSLQQLVRQLHEEGLLPEADGIRIVDLGSMALVILNAAVFALTAAAVAVILARLAPLALGPASVVIVVVTVSRLALPVSSPLVPPAPSLTPPLNPPPAASGR